MSIKPASKIEVWDPDGDPVYTDSSAITDALAIRVRPVVTASPGDFSVSLPAQKDFANIYDDIGANYTFLIYLGWGSTLTPILKGKTLKPRTKVDKNGAYRIFEGKDLGEQLERTFKTNKRWQNVAADEIVEELATDLGIYDGDTDHFDANSANETITVRTESYWNLLQKASDYWSDSVTRVQHDFCVGTDGKLIWKNRPWRTAGVESLNVLFDYEFTSGDILPSKNSITVYGAPKSYLPTSRDAWTEDLTDWSATLGTLSAVTSSPTPKEGDYAIKCSRTIAGITSPDPIVLTFKRTLPQITLRTIKYLNLWYYKSVNTGTTFFMNSYIKLLAPDASNYFKTIPFADTVTNNSWTWGNIPVGESAEHDYDENPTGAWTKHGDPNWWAIQGIEFYADVAYSAAAFALTIDKLSFSPERCMGTATDPTNQAIYGVRTAEYTDDNLLTDDECTQRAESLLMQLKNQTIALTCTVPGNTNLRIGDRLPVTLPLDNVSAQLMDIVSVEHFYHASGIFTSTPALIYSGDIRVMPPSTPTEATMRQLQHLKAVTSELYTRVVR